MKLSLSFTQIETHFGYGDEPPVGWLSATEANLLILVGVTGVGKSSTIDELANGGLPFTLIPNRRTLTDHLIIGALQAIDSKSSSEESTGNKKIEKTTPQNAPFLPVRDRKDRFAYTRRYREMYAGGMAHALTQLWISPEIGAELIIFDGLRGVNEVAYAVQYLANARFAALCAPDGVRVQRLLGRNDAFDQIQSAPSIARASSENQTSENQSHARIADRFPDAANLRIEPKSEQKLLTLLDQKVVTTEELAAKLAIVSEERRNYDPDATLATLQTAAPDRFCVVDTVKQGPKACAEQIRRWINL